MSAPTANFTGTPTSGDNPLTVVFTDQSSNTPTYWFWEKNDGSGWEPFDTPSEQNPTESFDEGTWSIRLSVENRSGFSTKTRTDYIESEAGYEGPLDIVPGAVVAFDQFAPSAAWLAGTNNYALLRRSSDNAELQFQYAADGTIDVAAITAWRDAAGVADASIVVWNDGSGNSHHGVSADDASEPVFTAASFGDVPAPVFSNSVNEVMQTDAASFPGAFTIFAVANLSFEGAFCGANWLDQTGGGFSFKQEGAASYRTVVGATDGTNYCQGRQLVGVSTYLNNPHIFEAVFQGATLEIRIDGASLTINQQDASTVGAFNKALCIGSDDTVSNGGSVAGGKIAAIYVYGSLLSSGNRALLRALFADRYSITLA